MPSDFAKVEKFSGFYVCCKCNLIEFSWSEQSGTVNIKQACKALIQTRSQFKTGVQFYWISSWPRMRGSGTGIDPECTASRLSHEVESR